MNEPLVTCLCLTMAGRSEYLKRAVECFRRQTYENKELLIVADSISDSEGIDLSGVSVISSCSKLNIGQKRNLGCEAASSGLIAVWDDDDFSAPGRLSQQVGCIRVRAVTGYGAMKFTDGRDWWRFKCAAGFVIGSSLCFSRNYWSRHPFPELQIGEDAGFMVDAMESGNLLECPDMGLMYATIHLGNTSRRNMNQGGWMALPGFQWRK